LTPALLVDEELAGLDHSGVCRPQGDPDGLQRETTAILTLKADGF
jgi:hypothetical protein